MSDLNLKDLLNKKWPLVELGEIATFSSGSEVTHQQIKDFDGEGIPCVKSGDINNSSELMWSSKNKVKKELLKKLIFDEKNNVLISQLSTSAKDIGKTCVYLGEEKIIVK